MRGTFRIDGTPLADIASPFSSITNYLDLVTPDPWLKEIFKFRKEIATIVQSDEYIGFMREYEEKRHMIKVSSDTGQKVSYCLPHNAVVKESSTSTKVRVFFDGFAKSTTDISINDAQLVGPVVQGDALNTDKISTVSRRDKRGY